MANAFTKAQFMEPPGSGTGPVPIGAVKAGTGIQITADGVINVTQGGGTINDIVALNGIQGGGSTPQVFLGLLPPTDTTIGGVKTIAGSGISIDTEGVIRSTLSYSIRAGTGITLSGVTPDGATINVTPAGANAASVGGVFVDPALFPGVSVTPTGFLSLTPPQGGGIGGVKAGSGVTIDPITGVLNATGSGGTITGVGVGTGLGGGGTTGAVTVFLKPANVTTIGGVYPGENVTIAPDGQISVADAALGVLTVTGTSPIQITGSVSNPIIGVQNASTSTIGVVTLVDQVDSTSISDAATPNSVRLAYELANSALPLTGGSMDGLINFFTGQTFPGTIPTTAFNFKGGLLVGTGASAPTSPYIQLLPGSAGQVLVSDATAPWGVKWGNVGSGTVTNVSGVTPIQVVNGGTTPTISVDPASTTTSGVVQLYDATDSTSTTLAATANSVKTTFDLANSALQKAGGTMTGDITFAVTQAFPGVLPTVGGTMTGDITFAGTQTFPGVLTAGSIGATGAIEVGGTPSNPLISVDTATTAQLGVVQPDGTTITINGSGVISAVSGAGSLPLAGGTMTGDITFAGTQTFPGALPLAGGTMTGNITFNAGQTFPGTVSSSLLDVTGDMVFASGPNTPASLPIGAAGSILAVNGGTPAWRTSTQLGLLTSSSASATYAPLNSPTFTGPVTVNAGGAAGANALVVSGGNLVLATTFTPTSSADTGSTGELAWDSNYLYFCYAPNQWGRVAVDLTPF